MPKKTKRFTGPFQNGSVNSPGRSNGNIYCVSMNHFEAATATKQQKGIAKKETLLPTKGVIGIHLTEGGGWGEGISS
jgi:hypothetical protein